MAPPLQALINILLLLAASVTLVEGQSVASPPSEDCYRFNLKHAGPDKAEHYMELPIGKSSSVYAIADTGSNFIWLPHDKCLSEPIKCPTKECSELMDNMKCCKGHCMFERKYSEGSFARGFMVNSQLATKPKTITIGCTVDFGCPDINKKDCRLYGDGGNVGLGWGKMSLLSQLGLKKKKFSFCLPTDQGSQNSIIMFGDCANLPGDVDRVKLKFIKEDPYKYYVHLKTIILNDEVIYDLNNDGLMLIDSGCTFSKLPKEAFEKVKKQVKDEMAKKGLKPEQTHSTSGLACYHIRKPPTDMPNLVLQFDENKMSLPWESYVMSPDKNGGKEIACLTIKQGKLTLGNFQMQNMRMLFDLTDGEGGPMAGTLTFVKDDCGGSK